MTLQIGSYFKASASAALLTLLLTVGGVGTAVAQEMSAQTFLATPAAVLQKNPAGGPGLISQIRDLAVANPATLSTIIGLLANASKDQKSAIASGLAQAAKIVVRNNPPYATQIQQAVAETKDQDVVLAFAGAAGDAPIGATGGAGAGSAGASGGQTTGTGGAPSGTGAAQAINGGSTATGAFSYTSSVSGGSTTTTGTGLTTNLISVVSP